MKSESKEDYSGIDDDVLELLLNPLRDIKIDFSDITEFVLEKDILILGH